MGASDGLNAYACGTQICIGAAQFYPYGATFYQSSPLSGITNPVGAVALAKIENFNTIRVVNFYSSHADPATVPFDPAVWARVDVLIATARAANIRVILDLADYRNALWNHCTNPYAVDWTPFLTSVATRVNTVTGATYGSDPEIVLTSFTGEPLPVGSHTFTDASGAACTLTYTSQQLTTFYSTVESTYRRLAPQMMLTAGGLGYLNFNSGIDWRAIESDPNNDVCAFKTYGGMFQWLPNGAAYCNGTLHKPWFNDEWGYTQSAGDATMAAAFQTQFNNNAINGAAGNFSWNAGYQATSGSYDVGPQTPLTLAIVQRNGRPGAP